jgi:hypothetical protein
MRHPSLIRERRPGFTLPELMVAAAMSLAIMAIIAVAFRSGIQTFRTLRAVGQMQDKLCSARDVIRRDLASEHFGGVFQQGFSGPYVRDQRLDLIGWQPPDEGYFEFRQAAPSVEEGRDSDGVPSFRAGREEGHSLRFTARLTGKRQEDWFYAYAGGTQFPAAVWNDGYRSADFSSAANGTTATLASRWAEIAYFLHYEPDPAAGQADTRPYAGNRLLGSLRRREKALLSTAQGSFPGVASVARVANRFGGAGFAYAADANGDDILLTDVISFEIRGNWNASSDTTMAQSSPAIRTPQAGHIDWPFDDPPASRGGKFDTGSRLDVPATYNWNDPASFNTSTPGAPRFRGRMNTLQIRVRIWDRNTDTARQMTIVQDI